MFATFRRIQGQENVSVNWNQKNQHFPFQTASTQIDGATVRLNHSTSLQGPQSWSDTQARVILRISVYIAKRTVRWDFLLVSGVFNRSVADLEAAGATVAGYGWDSLFLA